MQAKKIETRMTRKPKLELTWIGKEERPRLEPRILIEDPPKSHHASKKRDGDTRMKPDQKLSHAECLALAEALDFSQPFSGPVPVRP